MSAGCQHGVRLDVAGASTGGFTQVLLDRGDTSDVEFFIALRCNPALR